MGPLSQSGQFRRKLVVFRGSRWPRALLAVVFVLFAAACGNEIEGRPVAVPGQAGKPLLPANLLATTCREYLKFDEAARREVIHLLDELGFAPEQEDGGARVALTRCPLLEAAHRFPEVVCAVHLGIVRGALDEYGADATGTDLVPFAEPGACRLVVPPLDGTEP